MKTQKYGITIIPWLLFIVISILSGDYLGDGNFNTTYHILQFSHHYIFSLRLDNLCDLFHLYKQFLIEIELIALHLQFNNFIIFITLLRTVETFYSSQTIVQSNYFTIFHQNNFLNQYKNSFELHTDISRANISFP